MRTAFLLILLSSLVSGQDRPKWVVPSFNDLTIKTREARGLMTTQAATWYFKGTRERTEHGPAGVRPGFVPFMVTLFECDQRAAVHLRPQSKTYTISVAHGPGDQEHREHRELPAHPRLADGPVVTLAINSEDTGETRQVGGYEARHFKTTVIVQPGKGAGAKPGKMEADTWFLDIPGLNCHEDLRPLEWTRY